MDKKILSAAIIAVMAAPVAAVADTTLYGQVHMSVGAVDDSYEGIPLAGEDNMQVRSHASRLGVKGSEDLGGGLAANFKLEWEVNPDSNDYGTGDNTSGFARRDQWVGLSGRMNAKIRLAQNQNVPYMLVLGDNEMSNRQVSLRVRDGSQQNNISRGDFIARARDSITRQTAGL